MKLSEAMRRGASVPFVEWRRYGYTGPGGDDLIAWLSSRPLLDVELPEVATTAAALRPEQVKFREDVLKADGFRCVISGCRAVAALEAAHRLGRSWQLGHNDAADGWTLRADLHRLLDAGSLVIRDGAAWFDEGVRADYAALHGTRLSGPRFERSA